MRVTLADGRVLHEELEYPWGEPENPLTRDEMLERFVGLAAYVLPEEESRKIAAQMLRSRVSEFAEIDWPKVVAADLRKFLVQILERHLEKKLVTAGMLEKIGA